MGLLSNFITGACTDTVTDTDTVTSLDLPPLTQISEEAREEEDRVPHSMEDDPVFSSEILIEQPIDHSIEAAVEVGYEVHCKVKPVGDLACHLFWTDSHQDIEHIDRAPAHCKEEEDHKHG